MSLIMSSSMMPERIVSHSGTSYYNANLPSPVIQSSAPPYIFRTNTTVSPQTWSNVVSTCKPAPIPLPEISEFLREENMKIARSPSSLSGNYTPEPQSHFVTDDVFESLPSSHCKKDASSSRGDNLSKRTCTESRCDEYDESYIPPVKRKLSQEQQVVSCISKSETPDPTSQLSLTRNSPMHLLTPNAKNTEEKPNLKSLNDVKVNSNHEFSLPYSFSGDNLNRGNNHLPYFTSLMLDDNLSIASFYQNKFSSELERKSLVVDDPSKASSTTGSTSKDTEFCSNESKPEGDAVCVTGNKIYQVCSKKEQVCESVSNGVTDTSNKMDDVFDDSPPPSYIKLECQDPNANLYLYRQPNQNDLKEISWEDATNSTYDYGLLASRPCNGLLEDTDLSEVDNACMEHFERECQKEAVKEIEMACTLLNIPTDANSWTEHHVDKWIMWTVQRCTLPIFDMTPLRMSGAALCKLGEAEMLTRVPTCGDIIHARLRLWKSAAKMFEIQATPKVLRSTSDTLQDNNGAFSERKETSRKQNAVTGSLSSDENEAPTSIKPAHTSSIHLWMFLKELLLQPQVYGRFIRWIDKEKGVFKIEDSVEVARLWGVRKNRPAMNYDKLSRSIRQYYKKGIIKKTPVSQRLVYQFVNPAYPMPI